MIRNKYLFVGLLISIIVLFLITTGCNLEGQRIRFRNLIDHKSYSSPLRSNLIPLQNIIISNNQTLQEFWDKYGTNSMPKIDFEKYVVVGVFLGGKPNPGYGVKISDVRSVDNKIIVKYIKYLPDPEMGYITEAVYPYDMIYFLKTEGEIIFSSTEKVRK